VRNDEVFASDLLRGPEIPTGLLHDMPKVDLHVHLDGSMRFSTFVELSRAQGLPLPGGAEDATRKLFTRTDPAQPLVEYIRLFDHPLKVLQTGENLHRAARELVEDCAAENIWHVEVRYSPSLHQQQGLTLEQATDAVLEGLLEAGTQAEISTGLLIAGVRHRGVAEVQKLAELAVRYKGRGVTGFDLAGEEADNPPKRYVEAFYLILNNNINCTVHAGEAWGPESIHQALHYLGAHRIGHGTRLEEDPDLTRYVADHRIPVEVGLTSAERTGSMPAGMPHPLRRFLRDGIRVTLCTNNRMFLANSLTGELRKAVDTFDLTLLETENLLITGFKSAFLHRAERVRLLKRAISEFRHVRQMHGLEVPEE
jgi:adenosine deaminase